jgi:hypothetical protein
VGSIEILKNANDTEFDTFPMLQDERQRRMRQAMRLYPNAFARKPNGRSAALPPAMGRAALLVSGTFLHWAASTTSRILAWTTAHRLLSRGA